MIAAPAPGGEPDMHAHNALMTSKGKDTSRWGLWKCLLASLSVVYYFTHRQGASIAEAGSGAQELGGDGGDSAELDLVFLLDCTGSMGAYIDAAKENIEAIVTRLVSKNGQRFDLRFGIVAYRDHPPEDKTWVTKAFPFTRSATETRKVLSELKAHGGGDTPEAVGTALRATLDAEWRSDATKVVILIADAPPHGLEGSSSGDRFPNGEPNGIDPFDVLSDMGQRAITIYSVVPGDNYAAMSFFGAAAKQTNGQAVAMGSAAALADVVVGASLEEVDLEKLLPRVKSLTESITASSPALSEDEIQHRVWKSLADEKVKTRRTVIHSKISDEAASTIAAATSLDEARAAYAEVPAVKKAPAPPERGYRTSRAATRSAPMMVRGGALASSAYHEVLADAGAGADAGAAPPKREVELTDDFVLLPGRDSAAPRLLSSPKVLIHSHLRLPQVTEASIARVWKRGKARGDY